MKYAAIANWADSNDPDDDFPVAFMCAQLDVSRSGYYDWRRRLPSRRELCDAELADRIGELHRDLPGQPGVRRVFAALAAHGWRVGRKRVWRLMRAQGLQGRTPWRWRRTTIAGRRPIDAPDLLAQDFDVEATDTRWCSDITYIDTVDGFCFLATVIDPGLPAGRGLGAGSAPAHRLGHRRAHPGPGHPATRALSDLPLRPRNARRIQLVVATPRSWRCRWVGQRVG